MKKIYYGLMILALQMSLATTASARISVDIGLPNVSIGVNLPLFPVLSPVPGYPVYYAPQLDANYFFYDGLYWVYEDDNWYASSWYNGPWDYMEPEIVPLFVLRIPVAYYRNRPASFRGWQSNAPPRWGQRWGHEWEERRSGWDRWQRTSAPVRAPRPDYQRQYAGDRYPRGEQQQSLHNRNYRYQPRDQGVRQHLDTRRGEQRLSTPDQRGRGDSLQRGNSRPQAEEQKSRGNVKSPDSRGEHGQRQKNDEDRGRGRDN